MVEKISLDELLGRVEDPEIPLEDLAPYFQIVPNKIYPFKFHVIINEELVDVVLRRGEMLITYFNDRYARRRQNIYRRKINSGWTGLKLIAEGDSWFQYPHPITKYDDVIEHLMDDYPVYCMSAAGDTLENMMKGLNDLKAAIRDNNSDILLFSAGGNDIAGPELKEYLHQHQSHFQAVDHVSDSYEAFLHRITSEFERLFDELTHEFQQLKIIIHGYDWVFPQKNGDWIGPHLEKENIPENMWHDITRVMIDRFNISLQALADKYPAQLYHVDCRGAVGELPEWRDELHAKQSGCKRIAQRFKETIEKAR